jgi:hypothetical protein
MTEKEQSLTPDWIRTHLLLQKDYMIDGIARILVRYTPVDVLQELKGQFAIVCRPPESGATLIRSERIRGLHVIVLSKHLIPDSDPPMNFPEEYIALTLLHELAHIKLDHHPPSTDQMEEAAYALAIRWFNMSQGTDKTMDDLKRLKMDHDGFWLGDTNRVM